MRVYYWCFLAGIWLTHSGASIPIQGSGIVFFKTIFSDLSSKFKYRKLDLDQYREAISSKVAESIENFRNDQLIAQSVAQKDLESYMEKFNQLYSKNLAALEKQRLAVDEMRRKVEIKRPPNIDDSLDQFRRFYNESIVLGPYEAVSKQLKFNFLDKKSFKLDSKDSLDPIFLEDNLVKQTERLKEKLYNDWNNLFGINIDTKKGKEKRNKMSRKTGTFERTIRTAAMDLTKFQEDLTSNAYSIAISTQKSILTTIDKKDLRRETRNLEKQLKRLNREGSIWVDEKISYMESTLKQMQEKLQITEKDFEELLFKRKANMQYSAMNDVTLNQILNFIDPADKGNFFFLFIIQLFFNLNYYFSLI